MQIFKPHEALAYIAPHLPTSPRIVEAGAFNGTDTIRMAQLWPDAHIHAFEPVPELFQKLKIKTAPYDHIRCYQIALSDHDGTAQLYISEKPNKPGTISQGNSLLAPKERLENSHLMFPRTITVSTTTLDSWAAHYDIDNVDLLWLDMQGHERAVMHASPQTLKQVTAIFTEVSFIERYENQPLMDDVISWLDSQGFKAIGRDFTSTTDRSFGNILFVRK